MMKMIGVVVSVVLLLAMPCMASLPPVTLSDTCPYWVNGSSQANMVITLLGSLGISGIPPFAAMDLENGLAGDGIPDEYQLALAGAALCADPSLQTQLAGIKAQWTTAVTDLADVMEILLGPDDATSTSARLYAATDMIEAEMASLPPETASLISTLRMIAENLQYFLEYVNGIVSRETLPILETSLLGVGDGMSIMLGLSTEMQTSIQTLLTGEIGEILDLVYGFRSGIDPSAAAIRSIALTPPFTPEQVSTLNALADDAQTVGQKLDTVLALLEPGAIIDVLGTAKSDDEPFSAYGDYDGDGNTNLATYQAVHSSPADFVAAASGANPFWPGNPGVPVAGVLGLSALAGACALGGVLAMRRGR